MGVARARHLEPLQEAKAPMTRAALVIGGGIAGIQAATDLAVQGFPVTLVEKQDRLGGRLAAPNLKYLYPNMRPAAEVLEEKLERLRRERRPGPAQHRGRGHRGLRRQLRGRPRRAEPRRRCRSAPSSWPSAPTCTTREGEYGYGELPNVITSEELERVFCESGGRRRSFGGDRPESGVLHPVRRLPRARGHLHRLLALLLPDRHQAGDAALAEQGIDTTIFYRDIRTVSTGAEEMYREARGMGVLFVRIPPGREARGDRATGGPRRCAATTTC